MTSQAYKNFVASLIKAVHNEELVDIFLQYMSHMEEDISIAEASMEYLQDQLNRANETIAVLDYREDNK